MAKDANVRFAITEEILKKATTYVPLATKVAFAKTYAQYCIEPMEISTMKIEADATFTLPQMVKESTIHKQLYMMEFLLREYLHIDVPVDFSVADYDKYASAHIANQLERMKGNPAVKDLVFDLIADFKDFKKILDVEIFSIKSAMNDSFERLFAGMTLLSDPENVKLLTEQLKTEINKVAELQKKKKSSESNKGKKNEANV